jgi:hypothetical protein
MARQAAVRTSVMAFGMVHQVFKQPHEQAG